MDAPTVVRLATRMLRRVARADEASLELMYRSFQPMGAAAGLPPGDARQWLESLRGNPAFLMQVAGKAVGHAVLCPAGDSAEAALFVHQDWRGEGIGEELLTALIAEARRLGLRAVWGVAEPWNTAMIRLARRLGFVERHDGTFEFNLAGDLCTQPPAPAKHAGPLQHDDRNRRPAMTEDRRDPLQVLKFELEFLDKGGYGRSPRAPWRPQFIFKDSPSCMNYDSKEHPRPCSECVLMQFVPPEQRTEKVPCRHIPLNDQGETVDGLYGYGTQAELEDALRLWLHAAIDKLERQPQHAASQR